MTVQPYTQREWLEEAVNRFGKNSDMWKFKCPICGVITALQEWNEAGAPDSIAFACIGRFTTAKRKAFGTTQDKVEGPCNYTGGGLFRMNPVEVIMEDGTTIQVFDFAPQP